MHTFIKSILLLGSIIASFNQSDAFSRTKGKAGVFNLLKHTIVDGMVVLAIKARLVFFFLLLLLLLKDASRISSEVNSKSPCGISFGKYCNLLHFMAQKQEHLIPFYFCMVGQHFPRFGEINLLVSANESICFWIQNTHTLIHTRTAHKLSKRVYGKLGYVLTALINQQTKVKCAPFLFALSELKTIFRIFASCSISGFCTVLTWNKFFWNQKWVTVCAPPPLNTSQWHTHTNQQINWQIRVWGTSLLSFFCIFIYSIYTSFLHILHTWRSTNFLTILIQTQSDKMVTLSAHWQFIPD